MLKKIWKALDGSKTTLGLLLIVYSDYCGKYAGVVKITGYLLSVVGGSDKARKIIKNIKQKGD